MLKGFVSGVEKDIVKIPMRTANLCPVSTWTNSQSTDTRSVFQIRVIAYMGSTQVTAGSYINTSGSGTYTSTIKLAGTADRIVIKHNGSTRDLYLATVMIDGSEGEYYTVSMYVETNDPTTLGGIKVRDLMLNSGSTALPYEPYNPEGWEVRDSQDRLIWGRENIFEGTDSIPFKGYGVPISTIEVDGNGQQNGTPAPDNPVMPEFVGVRTANLFPLDATKLHVGRIENDGTIGYRIGTITVGTDSVTYQANETWRGFYTDYISVTEDERLTISPNISSSISWSCNCYDSSGNFLGKANSNSYASFRIFSMKAGTTQVRINVTSANTQYTITKPMLSLGSTALDYEPYGWAEYITCAGQTVPVYLGQVQTVRRIKCVDLGTLTYTKTGSGNFSATLGDGKIVGNSEIAPAICSHFKVVSANAYNTTPHSLCASINQQSTVSINKTGFEEMTATEFKDAMSGVLLWYALITEQTGIVNEPLCKIGNYYDTLTVTNQDVNINIPNGACLLKVDTTIPPSKLTISAHVKSATNWKEFRNYIRNGYGPIMYPVGTILYDNFGTETGTAYRVVAYDKHFDPSLTAQGYNHSVTLCEELLEDIYVFDNIEAMLYVETAIPAGTYKFTIPNYDATYGGNKTYYFTSTGDVPTDSHIVLKWDYQKPPASVTAYAGPNPQTKTTAITGFNSLALTEWVDGESPAAIDLGTVGGPTTQLGTSNFGKMNHIHRARYGSNNYLQSGVRQYINASTAANTWWQPQTIFDRPYSQRTQNGKLMKLNQDMVSVLAKPEIQSRTNNYFETTSLDGTTFTLSANYTITTDKMFLLSPMEVGLTTTDTTVGTTLDYYIDATNDKRIKYRKSDNTAYYWWLRTPYPTVASGVRRVYSSGALNSVSAINSLGVAPACIIQ